MRRGGQFAPEACLVGPGKTVHGGPQPARPRSAIHSATVPITAVRAADVGRGTG
jgi:hypothetical protein